MRKEIEEKLCLFFKLIIAGLLAAMVMMNILQVVTRYFVSVTILWVEDVSIVCMSWMVAAAVPLLWLMKAHMVMDVADSFLPKKVLKIFDMLLQFIGIGIGIGLVYVSCICIRVNRGFVVSVAGFDEMWRYVPLLFCGIFLTVAAVIKALEYIPFKRKEESV